MNDIFVTYPGGKNGSGVYQKIINQMPPHRMYVEAFLGGGAIMRAKRPAVVNVGIDLDKSVVREWCHVELRAGAPENLRVVWGDGVAWLREHREELGPDCLVYADPPYLMSTRSSQRMFYAVEMAEDGEHRELIEVLRGLKCMVMLSGYWSALYAELLQDWRAYSFQAMTRGGTPATEWVWCNFPEPVELHDYRYLGDTFRDRERIKRKKARWTGRLERMAPLERQALLMAIQEMTITPALSQGERGIDAPGSVVEEGDVDMSASVDGAMGSESDESDDAGLMPGEMRRVAGGLEYNLALEDALLVDDELRACIGGNGVVGPTRVGGGR